MDMIKFISNDPSVGLFYVQQHTHTAVPNLINLTSKIDGKSRQATLDTADSKDSIVMVRSMKESGFSIANEMMNTLRHSLAVVSETKLRNGSLRRPCSSYRIRKNYPLNPATWGRKTGPEQDGEGNADYISHVFKSSKEKASSFKWPHMDA
ncbi:uncharacterized protein LOC107020264 [Solanum pennellii]|uniref:Uncharacterized protein LOC107020264 n=1 Tax=Solanum pennellii TaxID=28526 RepID=A0ABM1VAS8_SOLPN|nr:uncharacterized protein LOC107020264 [Solanum pennellii]XP_027772846.1 uncharacterized protein LOC107020264 [Solanum pennellii]XP_027772847.1 uncharacterized protein LOC107020264 [Solanum pennellii]